MRTPVRTLRTPTVRGVRTVDTAPDTCGLRSGHQPRAESQTLQSGVWLAARLPPGGEWRAGCRAPTLGRKFTSWYGLLDSVDWLARERYLVEDLIRVIVLGLEWFALWLERSPLHVAWPIALAVVFQGFAMVVHVFVWFSRGMFLPLPCGYPRTTTGRGECRNRAYGEWHRCHLHGRSWRRRTDRHQVDPTLPRWQTISRGKRKDRDDIHGEGVVRSRSRSIGVLYYKGFTRRPGDVKRLLPELVREYRQRVVEVRAQVRHWWSGGPPRSAQTPQSGVSTIVHAIRAATKLALVVVTCGLGYVAVALVLRQRFPREVGARVTLEFAAAFLFFFAVAVVKNGIWGERRDRVLQPRSDWLPQSWRESAGSFGAMIVIAWLGGTIGRSLGDIAEALPTVVVLGGWLLLASLPAGKPRRRRSNRQRSRLSYAYSPPVRQRRRRPPVVYRSPRRRRRRRGWW
jgi:hypothetical protein